MKEVADIAIAPQVAPRQTFWVVHIGGRRPTTDKRSMTDKPQRWDWRPTEIIV